MPEIADSATAPQFDPPLPHVEGVTHRFVDAGGLRMHVAEAGAGDPVVLLHGFPQHWYMWRHVIPVLAQQYHVIVPDLRGFGWTEATPKMADYDKRNMAQDIISLLDAMEITQPVKLVGHDWGGWCGFIISMTAPERVERYLACNIPPPWSDPSPQAVVSLLKLWYQVVFATPGLSRFVLAGGGRTMAEKAFSRRPKGADPLGPEFAAFLDQFQQPARARAAMLLYRRMLTREVPSLIVNKYVSGRLTVPTRILFGVDDFAISQKQITSDHSKHADDITVELVENCGHFIVDEQPQLVAERALAWFNAS
ncbi:MAG: alpha/beta hydrolase [Thermoleophilaceae bacterium]|nr:alpha/beta hydrolase [Thermoleophilaceae bacterium]